MKIIKNLQTNKGFTLVEVLMAIGLFMTLIISLVSASHLSTKASQTAYWRVKATVLARETLEQVLAVRANNFGTLKEGTFHPSLVEGEWLLVDGIETIEERFERRVEIYRVQRELSCGGERVCPIVESGGVVDPVTFRAKVFVTWQEGKDDQEINLESLLTFWR